jgi:hypothetical protein
MCSGYVATLNVWLPGHACVRVWSCCTRSCVMVFWRASAPVLKCHTRFGEDVWDLSGANIATPS